MTDLNENRNSPYYVVIDLGSNSFHMLITRQLENSVQVVDKIKRKVRLAAGLSDDNVLSEQAILRGLTCLRYFAERLQNIPQTQTRIVATAAVRLAKNSNDFLNRANMVLGREIDLLSGQQEAELIYLGNAYTTEGNEQRLIIDIGGASTELIIGSHLQPKKMTSLNIGCVTIAQQFFVDGVITPQAFEHAKAYAVKILHPIVAQYVELGWKKVFGGSGTMQALAEILLFAQKSPIISARFLQQMEQQVQTFTHIDQIAIAGLKQERVAVFASGVVVLSALFDCFNIQALQLSNGALREGLLYQILPQQNNLSIRQQTIRSLMQRYRVDSQYAARVKTQAIYLFDCFSKAWQLRKDDDYQLLLASCDLHEIGLLLAYKNYQQHSAYIIAHADLNGFEPTQRQLLGSLVQFHTGEIATVAFNKSLLSEQARSTQLMIILRLAIILCRQRNHHRLPQYTACVEQNITLCLPDAWLAEHTLVADELSQEVNYLKAIGYHLDLS